METDKEHQVAARQAVAKLVRACSQTLVYFDGKSALSEDRLRRILRDAVRDGEAVLNS